MVDWRTRGEGGETVKRGFRPEQIIGNLREAEVLLSQGSTVGEAARRLGVVEQTCYRWHREYGGMRVEQAKRLKELEKENVRAHSELRPHSALGYKPPAPGARILETPTL